MIFIIFKIISAVLESLLKVCLLVLKPFKYFIYCLMQNEYGWSSQRVSILNTRKQNRLAKKDKKSYCEFHGMSAARMKRFELQKW